MPTNINNIQGSSPTEPTQNKGLKVGAPAPVNKANAYSDAEKGPADSSLSLSNLAKKLPELEQEARNSSGIDAGKVEAIKQSLDEGAYQIDTENLAQRLIQEDLSF